MTTKHLLSPEEEAECLKNLLSDPEDYLSQRLLQLQIESMEPSAHMKGPQPCP